MKPFIHVYHSLTVRIENPIMRRLRMVGIILKTQRQNSGVKIKFLFVKSLGADITLEKFCQRGFI